MPSFADEAKLLIPVNVEPYCLVAGYLGLFGFFFCGLPGVFAVGCGLVGLRALKEKPNRRGTVRAWTGIVLGLLQCILLCWLIFMAVS